MNTIEVFVDEFHFFLELETKKDIDYLIWDLEWWVKQFINPESDFWKWYMYVQDSFFYNLIYWWY